MSKCKQRKAPWIGGSAGQRSRLARDCVAVPHSLGNEYATETMRQRSLLCLKMPAVLSHDRADRQFCHSGGASTRSLASHTSGTIWKHCGHGAAGSDRVLLTMRLLTSQCAK